MPQLFERLRIREPRRLLQLHLDYVIMGVLVIAVGAVLPDLPVWVQVLIVIGTVLNPLLFLPLAFGPRASEALWFRLVSLASFACVTAGLTAAAVIGVAGYPPPAALPDIPARRPCPTSQPDVPTRRRRDRRCPFIVTGQRVNKTSPSGHCAVGHATPS